MRCDVAPGHSGRRGAPEIVEDPSRDLVLFGIPAGSLEFGPEQLRHVLVESLLCLAEAGDGTLAVCGEQAWAGFRTGTVGTRSRPSWYVVHDLEGELAKVHFVSPVVLRLLTRDRPNALR